MKPSDRNAIDNECGLMNTRRLLEECPRIVQKMIDMGLMQKPSRPSSTEPPHNKKEMWNEESNSQL